DDRAGRSGRNAEADHRADRAGGPHGARGTGLPAEVDRVRLRSQSRHNAREIPASPRSRCCFLDASSGGDRVEDQLTKARQRTAWAQAYPTRPVRCIVGYAPGGGTDIFVRLVGQSLAARLGQPFVIENRAGASSNIATEAVIRAPADGYTLLG